MRAEVDADLSASAYAGAMRTRSAGLMGFFKPARIEAEGSGARTPAGFAPDAYRHVEITRKKRREVAFAYSADDVVATVTPPLGSLGDPAPTREQRREALDPMAAVLQIAMGGGEAPCDRVVPVFDSKLRFDLAFVPDADERVNVRTRAYRGPAHHCRVYYRPVAGFDPEDLAEDDVYATPIHLWIAEIAPGVSAPVLIRASFGGRLVPFDIKIELVEARAS